MTETVLIEKCRQKNPAAQKALYDLYARKMMGVCMRYTADVETARDFLQEGFVSVFTNLDSYTGIGSFEGWIRRIIVNTALQHLRRNVLFTESYDPVQHEAACATEYSVIESLSAQDLTEMIESLPTGFRTVFNLYAIEGYSHQEIAAMLNISEGCSRSQYSRARKHLQQLVLSEYGTKYEYAER
ncbi:MAG: RNA polymerase sigma factor [Bacteroidales bacterium]